MATSSDAQAVRSLNKEPFGGRFVFKTFYQKIGEIEIEVYRSLDKVKSDPSEGSSFFRDCLLEWRELNTAEDFISFYEEMLPFGQTHPLVLLHKELIISKLLLRLQMKARLSLEPLLRLLEALSRDLQEDFVCFLPKIVDSLVSLLNSGAVKEPEIIEQIFSSWSYIMLHLQNYLVKDIKEVLTVTKNLRQHPKHYIQEFTAQTLSFLLRRASTEDLEKGIRAIMWELVEERLLAEKYVKLKFMDEKERVLAKESVTSNLEEQFLAKESVISKAVEERLLAQESGASWLLCYAMRRTSSRFHSKADRVLSLLTDNSILSAGDHLTDVSPVVKVVGLAFQRLIQEVELVEDLNLLMEILCHRTTDCITSGQLLHLSHLLSLFTFIVQFNGGRHIPDYHPLLECVALLVRTFIIPSATVDNVHFSEVVDKLLQLLPCILDGLHSLSNMSSISTCSLEWGPVFYLHNSRRFGSKIYFAFIKQLLLKDPCILNNFRILILSSMSNLIEAHYEDVTYLLFLFCEKMQEGFQSLSLVEEKSSEATSRIHSLLHRYICSWIQAVKKFNDEGNLESVSIDEPYEPKLALLWGSLRCCSHACHAEDTPSLLMDLVNELDRLLKIDSEIIAGVSRNTWTSLIGATLSYYYKLSVCRKSGLEETTKALHLAKSHKLSSHILLSVADFLDDSYGPTFRHDTCDRIFHPELQSEKVGDAIGVFAGNLSKPDKVVRLSTLRILCHYGPLECIPIGDEQAEKKPRHEASQISHLDFKSNHVIEVLRSIEATPLSVSTSRTVVLLMSKIQTALSAERVPQAYIPLILNGLIGMFHNRYNDIWNPASECLAVLIGKHSELAWNDFVDYFEFCQCMFQKLGNPPELGNTITSAESLSNQAENCYIRLNDKSAELQRRFCSFVHPVCHSTPWTTVFPLLLQTLQKVPIIVESHFREIVCLFLKFLGYRSNAPVSIGSFDPDACKGKEWKFALKEWLNLLRQMRNPKSLHGSQFLKEVLHVRLLDENDAEIQMKVLDCLLMWKDDFLLPYVQHLKTLISSKQLREGLTTWSLSRESGLIKEAHRVYLVPHVIRILIPKVRNLKTLASRKLASMHRKAVLGFIAQLDVDELPLFFAMLMKPLNIVPNDGDSTRQLFWDSFNASQEKFHLSCFLKYFTRENIIAMSSKKKYALLHVIKDVLEVFDASRLRPFLDLLLGCVVRILESCSSGIESIDAEKNDSSDLTSQECSAVGNHDEMYAPLKQFKDMRALCLKIISSVVNEHDHCDLDCDFWDLFFTSVKPLIDGFKQEGSSSEKPSSLFSCFMAMSRSHNLVSLLYRGNTLLGSIFSILTVTTASEAVLKCVLNFIDNLLNLESELEDRENALKANLLLNLETLTSGLHCLFHGNTAFKRKLTKHPGEVVIRIFKSLSKHLSDPFLARKFIDVLLPFLGKKVQSSGFHLEAVQVVRNIIPVCIPVLGSEITKKILSLVAPHLVSVELDTRLGICDLLDTLAKFDPSVTFVAMLLRELNATSSMEIDGVDYDIVVNAYEKIGIDLFHTIQEDQALVILSHCVHDMASEELILRHSAYKALLSFVEFSAIVLGQETNSRVEAPEMMITGRISCGTRISIQHIVNKFILKHMADAMNKTGSANKEWIELLREMVLKLHKLENLKSLRSLCSEDAEQDFFNNIVHLQKHRRIRALSRFQIEICLCKKSEGIINNIFVPLFFNMLIDVQDAKGEHIRVGCVDALVRISASMNWWSYYALLMRCFREMVLKPDKQKVFLRLICCILGKFHFFTINSGNKGVDSLERGTKGKDSLESVSTADNMIINPAGEEDSLDKTAVAGADSTMMDPSGEDPFENVSYADTNLKKCVGSITALEIQIFLQKTVYPKIQKLLDSESDKVNVTIYLAALKVLKLLPGDVMDSQLPSIIYRISNYLKSRMVSIRDEARSALAACLKELGLEYLQFIVSVLRATLKRGFELHVLGYTLNFILSDFLSTVGLDLKKQKAKSKKRRRQSSGDIIRGTTSSIIENVSVELTGKVDYCLEDLLSVVENDIFGEVAEQKEVEKIAFKMKETRKQKSFDTLELISQIVTFKTQALKLLSPVTAHMQKRQVPKVRTNMESMLKHIADGIKYNKSVDDADLLIFIYGLIEDGINEENGQLQKLSSKISCKHTARIPKRKTISSQTTDDKLICSHLTTVFALGMLNNHIKNVTLGGTKDAVSKLDPFVQLLGNCLSSKYEDVLSAAIKCLTPLIRLPVPSLESQADKIKTTLFDIAQSSVNSSNPLTESCLNLLNVLLRCTKIKLTSEQLQLLIQFPLFVDLKKNPTVIALSLLKAFVRRKLVVHEIFDLAIQVAELMVTSQVELIRQKCSQILLQFLLDYQLSDKRLKEHFDFLLQNLRYEHATGREAVLEILQAIIKKFEKSKLEKQSQTFFLHLVDSLSNDHDNKIRSKSSIVIRHLVGRMEPRLFLEYSLSWYQGDKGQLVSIGAQVVGLLVEVMKKSFKSHLNNVLPVLRSILNSAKKAVAGSKLDLSNEDNVPLWKEAYHSLILLEKMLHHLDDFGFEKDNEDIWEAICELLLHPHAWLRNISSRLVAFYFKTATNMNGERSLGTYFLMTPSRLFMVAASFCSQLRTLPSNDDVGKIITQNMVIATCTLHDLMEQAEPTDADKLWSNLEHHEKERFIKASQLLESRKDKGLFLSLSSGAHHQNDGDHIENLRHLLVSSLLKTMGTLSLKLEAHQMKIVFNSFWNISSRLSRDECRCYAYQLLLPVYKVCEGFSGKVIADDMKQLAQEVSKSIRDVLGMEKFVQVYNDIRKSLKAKRDKRRQEDKLMAVRNPERNAKRKLRITEKHRDHKKRKMMHMKMSRWMN